MQFDILNMNLGGFTMLQSPVLIGETRATPLGEVWAALSPRGLVCVDFQVSRQDFESAVHKQTGRKVEYAPDMVAEVTRQIKEYLQGKRCAFDLVIDWQVLTSDFQRLVLKSVFAIPYGKTCTYAEIATRIGQPKAFRAVGRANATNPMPLVIPCHRVIGTDGSLHGYGGAGGLKTKAWLLELEGAD